MSIFIQIFELYIRKRDPKDIDYNPSAALILFFVNVPIYTFSLTSLGLLKAPMMSAIALLVLQLAGFYTVLRLLNKAPRFVQMATAMLGVTAISAALLLTLIVAKELIVIGYVIQIWSFYLSILILQQALDCSFLKSIAVSLGVAFLTWLAVFYMFGDQQAIEEMQRQRIAEIEKSSSQSQ